jgi:SAM-dependent methyltransferase
VLDIGCGRGDRVAWLCEHGWDAYGADIVDDYVIAGRGFMAQRALGSDRLRTIRDEGLPFAPMMFDVVLSDQVLEHVGALDEFAKDIARVTASCGVGLHVFPAKWCPLEPHLKLPLVHWLPKGQVRRTAIRLMLRGGLGADYFSEFAIDDRVQIYGDFSDLETFYRRGATIERAFGDHGLVGSFLAPSRAKLSQRLPWLPSLALTPSAQLYSLCWAGYFQTVRRW